MLLLRIVLTLLVHVELLPKGDASGDKLIFAHPGGRQTAVDQESLQGRPQPPF